MTLVMHPQCHVSVSFERALSIGRLEVNCRVQSASHRSANHTTPFTRGFTSSPGHRSYLDDFQRRGNDNIFISTQRYVSKNPLNPESTATAVSCHVYKHFVIGSETADG